MTPSFFDELQKMAEVQDATWPRTRRAIGNILVGSAASGLGYGTGKLLAGTILPKVLPHASSRTLKILGGLGGGLTAAGSLATLSAMRRHREMLEEAEKK